jgi:tetratricopeptide (TPR) repeat protein
VNAPLPGRPVRFSTGCRPKLRPARLLLTALLLITAMSAAAGGQRENARGGGEPAEEIDYLGIAALMLKDGMLDRAESALANVDPADEGVNPARYYTIRGLLRLQRARYVEAASDLELAVASGQLDPLINVYLAQAYFGAEDYSGTLAALSAIPDLSRFPGLWDLKAHSHWKLGRTAGAFRTLEQAIDLFPERHRLLRQRVLYLLELGLHQEAAEQSRQYLKAAGEEGEAYVAVGEALRRAGAVQEATVVLEMGILKFPADGRILQALSRAYADQGRLLNAA